MVTSDRLLLCLQTYWFAPYPNQPAGLSLPFYFQNQIRFRPICRRSLLDIRRLRRWFSFCSRSWISVSVGQHGLLPRQPKTPSACPLLCGRLALHRWLCCPRTLLPVLQRWNGLSMSRHAHRSCRSPAAFQARSVPDKRRFKSATVIVSRVYFRLKTWLPTTSRKPVTMSCTE